MAQAPLGRALWPPGTVGPPPVLPFGIYLPRALKTPNEEPFFANTLLFRRLRDSEMGITRSSYPGTLSEGGLISGGSSITMLASERRRE